VTGENKIRLTRQVLTVQAVTKPKAEHSLSKAYLGLRVLALNPRHERTALGSREYVGSSARHLASNRNFQLVFRGHHGKS
jgi:hypothetical protein